MYMFLPMKDFGIVILSQTRSLTSSPDVGLDSILAILYIGVVIVSLAASPEGMEIRVNETWNHGKLVLNIEKNTRRGAWYEGIEVQIFQTIGIKLWELGITYVQILERNL